MLVSLVPMNAHPADELMSLGRGKEISVVLNLFRLVALSPNMPALSFCCILTAEKQPDNSPVTKS